jgi:hypothetical protein
MQTITKLFSALWLTIAILFVPLLANAQKAPIFSEGFEGATFPPSGWTATGDWQRSTAQTYDGSKASATPGNAPEPWHGFWLITPKITIPETGNYALKYVNLFYGNATNLVTAVRLSVYGNDHGEMDGTGDFTILLHQANNTDMQMIQGWQEIQVPLTDYAGFDVYIAFQYRNTMGSEKLWYIDNVSIEEKTVLDISNATITFNPASFVYTGEELIPEITVTLDGTTLVDGIDYTWSIISYDSESTSSGTKVGTVTVSFTGRGNYTGNTTKTYTITDGTGVPAVTVSPLRAYMQNGALHVAGLTAGEKWTVYSVLGIPIHQGVAGKNIETLPLNARGTYIVRSAGGSVKFVY